jgi:hypothetical protein
VGVWPRRPRLHSCRRRGGDHHASVFPVLLDYKLSPESRFTVTYSYRVQRRMMWGSVLVFKSEFSQEAAKRRSH